MKKILFSIASFFAISSMQAQTVVNVISNSPDHTYLEAAIIQEGLVDALNNADGITVFAPNDQAFEDLAAALNTDINGLLALDNLDDILLYHVLGAEVLSTDIVNGAIVDPLSPTNSLKLTAGSAGVFVNHAEVIAADIDGGNGTVHVVDGVLLPFETVVDVAIDNGFTSLYTAVSVAELLPALTNPLATFTVFAPTNTAFDNLAAALGVDIQGLLDLDNLQDILLYHVLDIEVFADDVNNGAILQPLSATNSLKFTLTTDGIAYANQAEITAFDIEASNGVVHILDAVVLPFETVADVAIDNSDFSTLTAAVVEARLLPALTDPLGNYTVFAPTNDAFDALATTLGTDLNGLLANPGLANILLYHVIDDEGFSTDLFDGQFIETLEGSAVEVSVVGTDVFINESQVIAVDLDVDNGVVHVIDEVLLPSELPATVVDIIVDSPDHNTLEAAVIAAGLADDLSGEGPFTVFAPTDAAFAALPEGTLDALLADIPALTNILLYHVAGANAFSSDLSDGDLVMTLEGSDVEVTINNDGVFINDAQVIVANIEADNGIVHLIDAVLLPVELPATAVDIIVNSPDHNTLETAVVAAGLVETLSGDGPFTVFAPTDAAFAALPAGTVAALLADIPALTNILTYHVVGAEAFSSDLTDGQMVMTLQGSDVEVTINGNGVFINNAQVTVADLEAENGVVHVINAVLLPSSVGVSSIESANFEIYPNPANNFINVRGEAAMNEIRVLDLNGRNVMNVALNGDTVAKVDVSGLSTGIYMLEIRTAEGSSFRKVSIN